MLWRCSVQKGKTTTFIALNGKGLEMVEQIMQVSTCKQNKHYSSAEYSGIIVCFLVIEIGTAVWLFTRIATRKHLCFFVAQ